MRLLLLHVDSFSCTATQRGRAALVEELRERTYSLEQGLLILASVEKGDDERQEAVLKDGVTEVASLARQLGTTRTLLHPFAHLFASPAPADASLLILDGLAAGLRDAGLECTRTPFGWFYSWDLRAKGHPLSRVARRIPKEETKENL